MASALLLVAVARWVDVASGLDPAGCSARRRAMIPLARRMTGSGQQYALGDATRDGSIAPKPVVAAAAIQPRSSTHRSRFLWLTGPVLPFSADGSSVQE